MAEKYVEAWIVVNNYIDGVSYTIHGTREAAKKKFLEMVKDLGKFCEDEMVLSNDADDFDELAEGGVYNAPNGHMVEITRGSVELESFEENRIALIACKILEVVSYALMGKKKWSWHTYSAWRENLYDELCGILKNGNTFYKETEYEFYRPFYPCLDNMGLLTDKDNELPEEDLESVIKAIKAVLVEWNIPMNDFSGMSAQEEKK